MGHYEEQDKIINWAPEFGHEEREARRPLQLAFGVGRSREEVAEAVARARAASLTAEFVTEQVERQAVFALSLENASIREIAEVTGISKSRVGRLLRSQSRDGVNVLHLPPAGTRPGLALREAWEAGE